MISDTTKNMKDIKDIIPQLLAVAFVAAMIFYPAIKKQADNSVVQSPEATASPTPQEQVVKLDKEKIEADFNKKYSDYLVQQKIPLDIKNKSWQVIDETEVKHQDPYYNYKIGTAEFRIYKRNEPDKFGSYDWRDRLEVFNKGEKLGDPGASPIDFFVIRRIMALEHSGDRYIFLENWSGGAHCCYDEYVFRLDEDNNLKPIEILSLLDEELSLESIIKKNGYLYLKLMDFRFRYFHTSFAGSPIFYQYLIIDGDKFIVRNGDFKDEYIEQAKIDQEQLDKYLKNTKIEEIKFYEWSPLLVEQTVNYLMAGESEKAWSMFDSYFQKFSTVSLSSLKDFDNYLTGYSGENIVSLDQFKLEIKQLLAERDFSIDSYKTNFSIKNIPENLPAVVLYGQMKRHSSSGMLAFYYYDIEKKQLEQPDNPRHWFWATIYPDDPKFSDLINVVSGDGAWDRVYKITGLKQEDDIGYYDEGSPVGDIIVKNIERYK